jgi:hypothetical protein
MKQLYRVGQVRGSHLASLHAHTRLLTELNRYVQALLPEVLQAHCCVANVRGDTLVLQVDAAVWATRLRFYQNQILAHWPEGAFTRPRHIQILLRTAIFAPPPVQTSRPHLSQSGAHILESTAASLKYAPLQAALRHLARHCTPSENTSGSEHGLQE